MGPRRVRRGPTWLLVVSLVTVLAGVGALVWHHQSQASVVTDMQGRRVQIEAGTAPSSATITRMRVSQAAGQRLQVPSVGLDVPLASMVEVNNSITPPTYTQAYWVRSRGVSPARASSGSVFVAIHTVHGGLAPGNYLVNMSTGRPKVSAGASVVVAGTRYTVDASTAVSRAGLPSTAWVWRNTPGRLVLITCLQDSDGLLPDNLVVTAHLTSPG